MLKFYNRTPSTSDFVDARAFENPDKANPPSSTSLVRARSRPRASIPIDSSLVPDLTRKALDLQAKEVFEYVIMTTFPLTFTHFAPRLDPNWLEFIRHHQLAQTEPVERAIRVLNLWYLGVKHDDASIIDHSRYAYGGALRSLARLIGNPKTRTADVTLATAIMLAVFEMLDPLTPHSWLVHSGGIGGLIKLRGARVHADGFARTMLVTIRSFLLADAFVRREPSFLGGDDWRVANEEASALEFRAGKGSWIGRVLDLVFNEISMGPGLWADATAVIAGKKDADDVSREELIERIKRSREIQRNLQRQLASASGEGEMSQMEEKKSDPGGRREVEHVRAVVGRCLQGLSAGIALLDQLLVLLEADKRRIGVDGRIEEVGAWGRVPVPNATIEGPFAGVDRPLDWLDQISMSMGTLAISNKQTATGD